MEEKKENPHNFKKGEGGRQVGAKSKFKTTAETLRQLGFDPLKEAVRRFRDPEIPNASQDYCLGLIMDRLHPKLKAVEHTGQGKHLAQVLINIAAPEGQLSYTTSTIDLGVKRDQLAMIEDSESGSDGGTQHGEDGASEA